MNLMQVEKCLVVKLWRSDEQFYVKLLQIDKQTNEHQVKHNFLFQLQTCLCYFSLIGNLFRHTPIILILKTVVSLVVCWSLQWFV